MRQLGRDGLVALMEKFCTLKKIVVKDRHGNAMDCRVKIQLYRSVLTDEISKLFKWNLSVADTSRFPKRVPAIDRCPL